jgi:hypothetical protein
LGSWILIFMVVNDTIKLIYSTLKFLTLNLGHDKKFLYVYFRYSIYRKTTKYKYDIFYTLSSVMQINTVLYTKSQAWRRPVGGQKIPPSVYKSIGKISHLCTRRSGRWIYVDDGIFRQQHSSGLCHAWLL